MSALLTTTMPNMGKTIEAFIDADLRDEVKIMVGGAPVTQEFADDMGADGYGKDAMACVTLAKALIVEGDRRPVPDAAKIDPVGHPAPARPADPRASPTSWRRPARCPPRRCPYKNRRDHCTAKFGCRNQRPPPSAGGAAGLRRRRQARLSERLGDRREPAADADR